MVVEISERLLPPERNLFLSEVIQLHAWASCRFWGAWLISLMRKTTLSLRAILNPLIKKKKKKNQIFYKKLSSKSSLIHEWATIVFNSHYSRAFKSPCFLSAVAKKSNLTIKLFFASNHCTFMNDSEGFSSVGLLETQIVAPYCVNDQVMISNAKIGLLNVFWKQGVINARHNDGCIMSFSCQVSINGLLS